MRLYPASIFNNLLEFDFIVRDRLSIIQGTNTVSYNYVSYIWGYRPNFTKAIRNREHYADLNITPHVDIIVRYFYKEITPLCL